LSIIPNDEFVDGLHRLGLDKQCIEPFSLYQQELLAWNARFNLTAITESGEIQSKHFLDSLSLLTVYDQPATRLLDIGSGAGFPGLALKIVRPQWRITLLEATNKKVTFLQHIIDSLQLRDIEVIHGRAEELVHKPDYRAGFDVVTARAVAALPNLLEYCAPYCRVGGSIILPKKGDLTEELAQGKRASALLGCALQADVLIELPGLSDGRRILVWRQQKLCPVQYPRSGGAMSKKPLGRER
jgi:16S rRNA (guanine527-N7)-methyltransferase